MTSIQSIFSGRMIENLSGEGIPFQSIKTQTSFAKGTLNLNNLDFESKAIHVNSQGTIDLINQELNIEAKLVPFETAKKASNIIPIVGEKAGNLTEIHIDIKGPLEDPKIHAAPIKRLIKDPGKNLKTFTASNIHMEQTAGKSRFFVKSCISLTYVRAAAQAGRYLQNFRAICLHPDDLRSWAHA